MSSCAASCCICSPRASFVSVTSAFWPTADAPPYCRCASLPWVRFLRRGNQKPPPRNPTRFGVAPSVVDRWRSSNDLPQLKSNSVLHQHCSQLRHETASPQLENSARFTALRPPPPRSDRIPTSRPVSHRFPPSILLPTLSTTSTSASVPTPADFNTSASLHSNLHKDRVRRASGFLLTAFSNARPNLCSLHTAHQGRASEKALASFELAFCLPLGLNRSEQFAVVLPVALYFRHDALKFGVPAHLVPALVAL